jgi:hypothetical protein
MAAVAMDAWDLVEEEIARALTFVLEPSPKLDARIHRTEVEIKGHTTDGRKLHFDVRVNLESNMLEAVDRSGTVWASAVTIEGLASLIHGQRVAPQ